MKRLIIALACCMAVGTANAQTTPENHAAHHPPAGETSPAVAPEPAQMQQRLHEMQGLMDQIEKTRDSKERQRLLKQHREAMHTQLAAMKQMQGKMGMGMKAGAGMRGKPSGPMDGMMECHEKMHGHMGMLLELMDQMLRHDAAEHDRR
jgi:hypothetical protein